MNVARASLDDVYLRHTGRTFSEAEAGHARGGGNGDGRAVATDGDARATTSSGGR